MYYLFGGLEHEFYFQKVLGISSPQLTNIFRGVQSTNQFYVSIPMKLPISFFLVILFVHHLSMGHLSHLYHIKLCLCLYQGGGSALTRHRFTLTNAMPRIPITAAFCKSDVSRSLMLLCFGARNCQGTKNTQKRHTVDGCEILHQLIGGLSHYLEGFNMFQPSFWCRISLAHPQYLPDFWGWSSQLPM